MIHESLHALKRRPARRTFLRAARSGKPAKTGSKNRINYI